MKALKLAAVLFSATALCCGATLGSAGTAVAEGAQAKPNTVGAQPATPSAGTPNTGIAKADNVVVTSGTATIRIKHVEVAGSSLTNADLVALFATKDPGALEARLRTLDATSIVIPEMVGDSADAAGQLHFTQQDVRLADVHGGRAATGSAAAAIVTIKNDKTDTRISTGSTTFKGLDLAQIVHLADVMHADNNEAPRPVCDEIAIGNVTSGGAADAGPPVAIATIRATGLKGRPYKAPPTDDASDAKTIAATLNDVAHAFSADLIQAEDFSLAGPVSTTTKGLKSLALKHVAVHGFGDGKLARFELNGLAMEGNDKQPGKLSLASADLEGVATSAASMPSIDRIDLHDFAIDVPADDKSSQRIALAVAHAGYEAPGLVIGKLPAKAKLSIEHATFDVPPDSGAAPMLLAMGYKHLDISSESQSRFDAAAQTLDLDRFSITGVGMGVLDIKLGLAKVSEGIVSQIDTVQKAAAAAVLVKQLDLSLRNDGLIDKAIGFKAAVDGVSVEQERTNLDQIIDLGVAGIGLQDSPKAQLVVAALHKFIAEPKTLHIAISSKDGLGAGSVAMIGSPQALLDVLEIEAGANR